MREIARTAAALLVLTVLGCSGPDTRRGAAEATPEEQTPAPLLLDTQGGLAGTGKALAELLAKKFPEEQGGRLAVGWDARAPWLLPLAKGFTSAWPSALMLQDLGVQASKEDEAYLQLDPAAFSGLLWLEPVLSGTGALEALDVDLRSTSRSHAVHSLYSCQPPLGLSDSPKAGPAEQPLIPWMNLQDRALAMAWEGDKGRMWVASADTVQRIDPSSRHAVQHWGLPPLPPGTQEGRQVLHEIQDEGRGQMGWFDLARGQGRLFAENAEGQYEPAGAIEGFPLPEKVQRFFTAPFAADGSAFSIQDFRGQELATCVDLARFSAEQGSLFALLGADGAVRGLRGSDLALMSGPKVRASALCTSEHALLAASQEKPYRVIASRPNALGDWAPLWTSPQLPGPVTALCAGSLQGGLTLFVAVDAGNHSDIYALALPQEAGKP